MFQLYFTQPYFLFPVFFYYWPWKCLHFEWINVGTWSNHCIPFYKNTVFKCINTIFFWITFLSCGASLWCFFLHMFVFIHKEPFKFLHKEIGAIEFISYKTFLIRSVTLCWFLYCPQSKFKTFIIQLNFINLVRLSAVYLIALNSLALFYFILSILLPKIRETFILICNCARCNSFKLNFN